MKVKDGKTKLVILSICCMLLTVFLSGTPFCMADDDDEESEKHHGKHEDSKGNRGARVLSGQGHDDGNETTGEIVAWSLGAANLTVALSLIIRGVKRYGPMGQEAKNILSKFNSTQKKYLMWLHYVLNPVILVLAVLHWTLSRCRSTALPEWGLLTMGVIVALGFAMKFKLCPKAMQRNVYRVHTHPVLFLLLIAMLVVGHLSMD